MRQETVRQAAVRAHPQDDLAARLRLLQEVSGRGVRALARDTGLSSSSLSRYFGGQTVPPWPAVVTLCRLVGRDPRPLRPVWERASNPLPAPPKASRQVQSSPVPAGAPRPPRNDLPRDVPDFTGRAAELAAVLAAVADSRVVAVDGMAGVGKSCLAVHAAHRLTADYPDAQLYVDLHGFTEGREPLDPDAALRSLLSALDVPSERVPQDDAEQLAACWRSELARRRAVVVLDNAADAEQVRPLLPGAGPSVALVTSRNRLLGLDEVPPVSLDVMSPEESAELLARASGDPRGPDGRLAREPESTAEVLRLCGRLPLALRLAAARLRHRPGWTVGVLVERMADQGSAFDAAFGAAFAMSVRQLPHEQRRLFRMLGVLPGSSFDVHVVAALAGVAPGRAFALLEDLLDAHLVDQPADGRYRLHDLVRAHARRAGAESDPPAERDRAVARVLDYYVHAAAVADAALPFHAPSRTPTAGRPPAALPRFADKHAAMDWYRAEYANLMAAFGTAVATGADTHVCELPRFMRAYFARRCGTTHLNALFEQSLAAARRLGDPLQLAEAHSDLGFARHNAGRLPEAGAAYASAAALLAEAGATRVRAELALRQGYLAWDEGRGQEALAAFRQAGARYAEDDCPAGAAHAVAYEAWAVLQTGHCEEAARLARRVLETPHPDPAWPPALTARITLGVAIAPDAPQEAVAHLEQALAQSREDGHRNNEAWCLNCLGVVLRRIGRHQEALARHREAFALLDELFEEHWRIRFLDAYAESCRLAGQPEEALRLHRQALDLAPRLGHRHAQALAHEGIAAVLETTDPATAAGHRAAGAALRRAAERGGAEWGEADTGGGEPGEAGKARPGGTEVRDADAGEAGR